MPERLKRRHALKLGLGIAVLALSGACVPAASGPDLAAPGVTLGPVGPPPTRKPPVDPSEGASDSGADPEPIGSVAPGDAWVCGVVAASESAGDALLDALDLYAAGDADGAREQARVAAMGVKAAMGDGEPPFDQLLEDPLIGSWAQVAITEMDVAMSLGVDIIPLPSGLFPDGPPRPDLTATVLKLKVQLPAARAIGRSVDPEGTRCGTPWHP